MLGILCGPAVIYCALGIVHNLKTGVMTKWDGELRVCEEPFEKPRYYVDHQCGENDVEICACR